MGTHKFSSLDSFLLAAPRIDNLLGAIIFCNFFGFKKETTTTHSCSFFTAVCSNYAELKNTSGYRHNLLLSLWLQTICLLYFSKVGWLAPFFRAWGHSNVLGAGWDSRKLGGKNGKKPWMTFKMIALDLQWVHMKSWLDGAYKFILPILRFCNDFHRKYVLEIPISLSKEFVIFLTFFATALRKTIW